MIRDAEMKSLIKLQDYLKEERSPKVPSKCGWCSEPLSGKPSTLPLGGEARFFDKAEVHDQCWEDMLEDWKRSGQWRGWSGTTKVHMSRRRGIHLVIAAVWHDDQETPQATSAKG